jgi:plastocyanin
MSRLARITIATIVGLQVVFWISVVLWVKLSPQVTQNSQQTAQATGVENVIVVEMNDKLRFVPTGITINAGDTVEWRNTGSVPHTVTADPRLVPSSKNVELPDGAEPFDSGWVMAGQRFRYTFSEPGVYRYICLPHERARMLGTVIVG